MYWLLEAPYADKNPSESMGALWKTAEGLDVVQIASCKTIDDVFIWLQQSNIKNWDQYFIYNSISGRTRKLGLKPVFNLLTFLVKEAGENFTFVAKLPAIRIHMNKMTVRETHDMKKVHDLYRSFGSIFWEDFDIVVRVVRGNKRTIVSSMTYSVFCHVFGDPTEYIRGVA